MIRNDAFDAKARIDRMTADAASTAKDGVERARGWLGATTGRVQDGMQVVRGQANDATDRVLDYVRDEPVKALLIAAVVGAGLIGLLAAMTRSDD